jgi:hypothetical protein
VVVVLVAALAGLTLATPASAGTYRVPRATVLVSVADDGSVHFAEAISVSFSGSFTFGYRDIPLRRGERITDVSVAEGPTAYRPGAPTALVPGGPAGTYGVAATRSRVRIVWRYRAVSETRTFTVRYAMTGVAKAYDDVVDVDIDVWGDQWDVALGRIDAVLTGPADVRRAWGHSGHVASRVASAGARATLRARGVPARQVVELRALFPRSAFTSTTSMKVIPGSGLGKIVAEEKKRVTPELTA